MIIYGFTCSLRNWIMKLNFGWSQNSRLVIFFDIHNFLSLFVKGDMKYWMCMCIYVCGKTLKTTWKHFLSSWGQKLVWTERYIYLSIAIVTMCIHLSYVYNIRTGPYKNYIRWPLVQWSHLPFVIDLESLNGWMVHFVCV